MKSCSKCGVIKGVSQFYNCATSKDGLAYSCKSCCSEYHKERRHKFPEKVLAENLKSVLAYQARNPDKRRQQQRKSSLKFHYNLSLEDFEALKNAQSGACLICGLRPPFAGKKTGFFVDHCHKTGGIRGLLCQKCNGGLGMFGDSILLLEKAIAYLRKGAS